MTIQFKVLMILLKNVKKSLFNKCLKYCELYESNILKLFIHNLFPQIKTQKFNQPFYNNLIKSSKCL